MTRTCLFAHRIRGKRTMDKRIEALFTEYAEWRRITNAGIALGRPSRTALLNTAAWQWKLTLEIRKRFRFGIG